MVSGFEIRVTPDMDQTAFGIKPISIGGVVSVKDTLDITFSIAVRRP